MLEICPAQRRLRRCAEDDFSGIAAGGLLVSDYCPVFLPGVRMMHGDDVVATG